MLAALNVLVASLSIFGITLLALFYLGYGLTKLLLPRSFRPEGVMWMPFVGYTLMAVLFHYLNVNFLDGTKTTLVIFIVATVINVAAAVLEHPAKIQWPGLHLVLLGVTLLIYFVGILPLFPIGHLTAIGKNWDLIDVYDPSAAYVISHTVSSIVSGSPPNPLSLSVTTKSSLSNGWGLTYLQAMASILTGRSPIETQAPIMSLLHAFMIPAFFIFFRRVIALRAWLSLAIATALGLHALILSMLLIALGNHAAMLGLMPLVLASSIVAINTRKPRAILLAALLLADIPLTFWSGIVFYVAPIGIYALIGQPFRWARAPIRLPLALGRPQRLAARQIISGAGALGLTAPVPIAKLPTVLFRRCTALAGIAAGSVIFGLVGYERIWQTVVYIWQNRNSSKPLLTEGWGSQHFIDTANVTGFSYWTWPAPTDVRTIFGSLAGGALLHVQTAAMVVAVMLACYGLYCLTWRRKMVMLSFVGGYALLLIYLRFISVYYYGYLKALTFVAFVLVGLAGMGLYFAWVRSSSLQPSMRRPTRTLLAGLGTLFSFLILLNGALTVRFFYNQPETALTGSSIPPASLQLSNLARAIPAGEPVFVSPSPPLKPETVSPLTYFLRDHPLYGDISGFESHLLNMPPLGQVEPYGVLSSSENPQDRGYDSQHLLWTNGEVSLYKRGDTIAHLLFDGSNTLAITPSQPLLVTASSAGLALGGGPMAGVSPKQGQLSFELAALTAQEVQVKVGADTRRLTLPAGLSQYTLASAALPEVISITTAGSSPVYVRSINLQNLAGGLTSLQSQPDMLVAVPSVQMDGAKVSLGIRYAGPGELTDHMTVGLNVGGNAAKDGQFVNLGWWGTALSQSDVKLNLDLQSDAATASSPKQQLFVSRVVNSVPDGTYSGAINFWEGNLAAAGWKSPFYTLFDFQLKGHEVVSPKLTVPPIIYLPLRYSYPLDRGAMMLFKDELAAVQSRLSPNSQVFVSPGLDNEPHALAALKDGLNGVTLYSAFLSGAQYPDPGRVYPYAVLAPNDDPATYGYSSQDLLLKGADFSLYKKAATALAHLDLKQGGDYPELKGGQSMSFFPGDETLTTQSALSPAGASNGPRRQLTLGLASLSSTSVEIKVGSNPARSVKLPGGAFEYRAEPAPASVPVTVTGAGPAPVYLTSADLGTPTTDESRLSKKEDAVVLSIGSQPTSNGDIRVDVHWAGASPSLPFYLGVNANGNAAGSGQWFGYGWWGTPIAGPAVQMNISLKNGSADAQSGSSPLAVSSSHFPLRDGTYGGTVSLWNGALVQQGWSIPFFNAFHFQSSQGTINNVSADNTQLAIVSLATAAPTDVPASGPRNASSSIGATSDVQLAMRISDPSSERAGQAASDVQAALLNRAAWIPPSHAGATGLRTG